MRAWRAGSKRRQRLKAVIRRAATWGLRAVELDRLVGEEAVAGAVLAVEAQEVLAAKVARTARTRLGLVVEKAGWLHEALDALDGGLVLEHGLEGEPLVHDQGLVLPGGVEIGQGLRRARGGRSRR